MCVLIEQLFSIIDEKPRIQSADSHPRVRCTTGLEMPIRFLGIHRPLLKYHLLNRIFEHTDITGLYVTLPHVIIMELTSVDMEGRHVSPGGTPTAALWTLPLEYHIKTTSRCFTSQGIMALDWHVTLITHFNTNTSTVSHTSHAHYQSGGVLGRAS